MKPFLPMTIFFVIAGVYPVITDSTLRYFNDISVYPYRKAVRFNFYFSYFSTYNEKVTFYFDFSNAYYTNANFYAHVVTLSNYTFTDFVTVPSSFLGEDEGIIRMRAIGTGYLVEKFFTISAIENATINPFIDAPDGFYSCNGKPVYINKTGSLKYYYENLTFFGFETIFESFAYHRLNFGNILIHYDCDYNQSLISYSSADFYLNDPLNLFPNLVYDSDRNFKHLNGQLVALGQGNYSFSLSDKMYVDPTTLMMMVVPNIGYTLTDFLYFPKNQFSKLRDISFRITISDIGINQMKIDFFSSHFSDYRFFGDCVNSAYCVTVEDQPIDVGYEISWEETTDG